MWLLEAGMRCGYLFAKDNKTDQKLINTGKLSLKFLMILPAPILKPFYCFL